jgi:hypothetical protein
MPEHSVLDEKVVGEGSMTTRAQTKARAGALFSNPQIVLNFYRLLEPIKIILIYSFVNRPAYVLPCLDPMV